MENIQFIRLSDEDAYKLDFKSAGKSFLWDWKNIYAYKCERENLNFISQGSLSDYEYYKKVNTPSICYRLFDGDKQIGEARVVKSNGGICCIELLKVEEEFR